MTTSCLTDEYKHILGLLIDKKSYDLVKEVIEGFPRCEEVATPSDRAERAPRRRAEAWNIKPVLVDEEGKSTTFSSPTSLIKHLDVDVSGTICDPEGRRCHAMSLVDSLRISGYLVTGDGEPEKGVSTKMTVYHPGAPKIPAEVKKTHKAWQPSYVG